MSDMLERKPRTRGECAEGPRPCPWASCRYNMITTEVHGPTRNYPDGRVSLAPEPLRHTCALDVADRGESTLQEIALMFGVTREAVRQMEFKAMRKVRLWNADAHQAIADLRDGGSSE